MKAPLDNKKQSKLSGSDSPSLIDVSPVNLPRYDWPGVPDRLLIRQAIENIEPERSLVELWSRYKKRLYVYIQYKIIRKPVHNLDQERYVIEDVLQNVFTDALDHLNEYNPQFEVSTWLYTIANKHIMRYIREVNKHNSRIIDMEHPSDLHDTSVDRTSPDLKYEMKEFEAIILRFIHSLRRKADQDVFILFIQNLNTKNISEYLGKTSDSVRSRLNRVFKIFKRFLIKYYPEYYNSNVVSNIKNLNISEPQYGPFNETFLTDIQDR
jgi:RNA polymerase sigma factor (sigma-70 family)